MLKPRSTETLHAATAVVEFAIEKDGTVSAVALKTSAVSTESPFVALPANYRGKRLAIRLQCDYKLVGGTDDVEKN